MLSTIYIEYIGYIGHICHSRKTTSNNNGGRMGIKKSTILQSALCIALLYTAACKQQENTFTDKRDGKVYKTVKIGSQVWMAENLNYNTWGFWRQIGWIPLP